MDSLSDGKYDIDTDIEALRNESLDWEDPEFKELGDDLLSTLNGARQFLSDMKFERCLSVCDILIDALWERLHTGHWKDVSLVWRKGYSIISHIKALSRLYTVKDKLCSTDSRSDSETDEQSKVIKEIIRTCDMGLLMGYPKPDSPLCHLATYLQANFAHKYLNSIESDPEPPRKKMKVMPSLGCKVEIEVVNMPSLESFLTKFYQLKKPVILKGCMDDWPASNKWDLDYLNKIAGWRVVPIEVGSKYTDDSWTQKLMTVEEFIKNYLLQDSKEIGYLAQHQLFDQIPDLQEDIIIPDYCALSDDGEVETNAWFGPGNTVSPLHRDEKSNIFCQVRGQKYFRLYDPIYTDKLYVHEHHLLKTTSQVDVESPDLDKFPEFANVPFMEFVVSAGEMLFIPSMHWHYVRSLSTSFSVSFWWNGL